MLHVQGYTELEQIDEGTIHVIVRARSEATGDSVILKMLRDDIASTHLGNRLRREYSVSMHTASPRMVPVLALEEHRNLPVLVKTDVGGQSLDRTLRQTQLDLHTVVRLSLGIAEALDAVHAAGVMHKDVKPSNLIVSDDLQKVWITDFDISSQLRKEHASDADLVELAGSLPYVSPEQTGRMNRTVDQRSDLYSLGATLYEMLTGKTPFVADDAMEYVHCHIARQPEPPSSLNSNIPSLIDAIVLRLLSKTAEERYQSAFGVAADLRKCYESLLKSGNIHEFALGSEDLIGTLRVPEKLYGRSDEIEQLLALYEKVSISGLCIATVYGYSGIGKSSLVHETHKPITRNNGRFLSGKFDQYKKSLPYHGLVQAFDSFGRLILSGTESLVNEWKNRLLNKLGPDAKVVADLVPALELLLGSQAEVPELGGHESQLRMNRALARTLQAIASAEHPLVLFLDDLQWADSGTLSFVESLAKERIEHVLLVVAYRDNEVDPAHPSMRSLHHLRENGIDINEFHLSPLSQADAQHLLSDTLGRSNEAIAPLVKIVVEKTGGNPFFIGQFLRVLNEENLIVYDRASSAWNWDINAIALHGMTDNVVDLLSNKLRSLPQEHQIVLATAAAIGGEFDLTILAHIVKDVRSMAEAMWQPLVEGLIRTSGIQTIADVLEQPGELKSAVAGMKGTFTHDKIRQAAIALIKDSELKDIHRRIARAYVGEYSGAGFEDRLFEVASHVLAAEGTTVLAEERAAGVHLLYRAGIRAQESCAFSVAVEYLNACRRGLPEDIWETDQRFVELVERARLETTFALGDVDALDRICDDIARRPASRRMRFHVEDQRRRVAYAKFDLPESIRLALKALAILGVRFPKKPNKGHAAIALIKTALLVRGRSPEVLANLPESTNEDAILCIRTIAEISEVVYYNNRDLFPLILLKQVYLTITYGNHANSASVYVGYALIRTMALNDVKGAYGLAKAALSMPDKFNAREFRPKNEIAYAYLLQHRREHYEESYALFRMAYSLSLETGMHADTANSTIGPIYHGVFQGKNFEKLIKESKEYISTIESIRQQRNLGGQTMYLRLVTTLCDPSMPKTFDASNFNEAEYLQICDTVGDYTNIAAVHLNHVLSGFIFNDQARVLEHIEIGRKYEAYCKGLPSEYYYPFFHAIARTIQVEDGTPDEKKKALSKIKKDMKVLRRWAADAPMNYEHRLLLVEAEIKRIQGKIDEAGVLYDKAIDRAASDRFLTTEAIANDIAARMYDRLGDRQRTLKYLRQARQCYRQLGVAGKVRLIEQMAPELSIQATPERTASTTSSHHSETTSMSGSHDGLDLATVMKASHVIAAEIDRRRLLDTTMRIMMENAGADRGVLLMERNGAWNVESEMEVNSGIFNSADTAVESVVPSQVLSYVSRTRETVVVSNAMLDERFNTDPFIISNKPRSFICMPILHQSKRVGILYLENSLTEGAFTPERIAVLNLLTVQSAISLENAELYEGLERKVAERTKELQTANEALDEEKKRSDRLLLNILPSGIVERLKQGERTIADRSTDVSVMFADIANFTQISAKKSPEDVVHMLNEVFNTFDDLVEKYGLEKIKTIGDAYMVVAGLPEPRADHAVAIAHLAIEMQSAIPTLEKSLGLHQLGLRIGIHTGAVVAGVIGRSKFSYDIWGDTVNLAARMESHGAVGKVHVTQVFKNTVEEIEKSRNREIEKSRTTFVFEQRGTLDVKGKGEMTTYFLS